MNIKALVIESPGNIFSVNAPVPEIGSEDALVKVAYSGICATDLAILNGNTTLVRDGLIKYPIRIGHEWSGMIERVGENISCFKTGDRVVSDSGVSCGHCKYCLYGCYASCTSIRSVGTINCWDGSFAEYIAMPARHLYKLPDNISLMEGALIEPSGIALSGIKKANISRKSTVLVIGTGAIGLAAVAFANYFGARKVLLSGHKDCKLEVGRRLGADVTVNVARENLKDIVMEQTGGKGADIIIEASGSIQTITQSIDLAVRGGQIILIGFYEKYVQDFPVDLLVTKELRFKGVMGEFGIAGEVIDILKTGKIELLPLVSHVIPLDRVPEVMKHVDELSGTKIKIMTEIGGLK